MSVTSAAPTASLSHCASLTLCLSHTVPLSLIVCLSHCASLTLCLYPCADPLAAAGAFQHEEPPGRTLVSGTD